jgi:formyl-CoA transferase
MTEASGPLGGIRVLDLSRVLAGPYCTMTLGDLGAEIIKVERPETGDDTRGWGPPWAGGEAAYYLSANRNKHSITVNLKHPDGQRLIRELAAVSDVVVENYKLGTLERMGIGWEQLQEENPRLIWATISGYGPDGPDAEKPGYDFVAQGEAGIMAITGEPGGEPMKVGVAIVDVTTGLFTALSICAALRERELSGLGQRIDTNLLSSGVAWLINVAENYLVSEQPAKRWGNAHANIVPYQSFRARDQHITVAVGTDRQFRDLCRILGCEELADDPRFVTNTQRVGHRAELIPLLAERIAMEDAEVWLPQLSAATIPAGKINTIAQVFEHPQVLARNMLIELPHPTAGTVRMTGVPMEFSRSKAEARLPPPLLGEHTDVLLGGLLGKSAADIARLRESGAI